MLHKQSECSEIGGAHPQTDPLKDVTLDDASEIINFTSEFLDEVFVRPARLDALKQKKKTSISLEEDTLNWIKKKIKEKKFASVTHAIEYALETIRKQEP